VVAARMLFGICRLALAIQLSVIKVDLIRYSTLKAVIRFCMLMSLS